MTKPTTGQFVRLTYTTLARKDLTLSEKIILDYRNGFKERRFFARNDYISGVLGIPLKTVKNCISSLRKKRLWEDLDRRPKGKSVSPKKGLVIESSSPKKG